MMKPIARKRHTSPWGWVPTLYFAEGLPYVAVMTLSVILYKRLGLSNTEIALYTSWLYLPWTIKPLWSPIVDLLKSKRWWIIGMQSLVGAGLAGVAFFIPTDWWVQASLACFWLMAFSSATHDIAADGFYMTALPPEGQSLFVGIRNTFYRLASIFGQGVLVMLAGWLEISTGNIALAWSLTFYLTAALFIALTAWHCFALPHPATDAFRPNLSLKQLSHEFAGTFSSFFRKKNLGLVLFFLLTYRLGESQLVKIVSPFLLDNPAQGGLGLSTATVGMIYGTVGVAALLAGGIAGGWLVSRQGLKRWMVPMALAINLPDLLYVYLAAELPQNIWLITGCVVVEQLGYGFGFTAYTLFLIHIATGKHPAAHYAIGTAFMALGMMLPGMPAGWLQEQMGYTMFFIWVCLWTIPGIAAAVWAKKSLS